MNSTQQWMEKRRAPWAQQSIRLLVMSKRLMPPRLFWVVLNWLGSQLQWRVPGGEWRRYKRVFVND